MSCGANNTAAGSGREIQPGVLSQEHAQAEGARGGPGGCDQ